MEKMVTVLLFELLVKCEFIGRCIQVVQTCTFVCCGFYCARSFSDGSVKIYFNRLKCLERLKSLTGYGLQFGLILSICFTLISDKIFC